MEIKLRHLAQNYQLPDGSQVAAIRDLSLDLPDGSFHVLVGKSGCGKTTLLRLLAGLEQPAGGTIDGLSPAHRRGIMFQSPRLLPWLNVWDNICFWRHGCGGSTEKAAQYLKAFGLEPFKSAYPQQLSGGLAQRVALARTLASEPDLLLLDEPFAALDYFTRRELQDELMQIFAAQPRTVLFVTHDITDAPRLGQYIHVMADSHILKTLRNPAPYPRPILADRLELEQQIIALL